MGSSRFLKSVRARHTHGRIVVKTFIKPDPSLTLRHLVRRLRKERETLATVPNVLTYQKVIETERAGYLIRQWLASSLYDRISTRPFLTSIEKKWITYQLLSAMQGARSHGISHGDLKSENILVTSSMSVFVTDFASSFKPTYLPLDDPADFSFFFDTSGRRTCYVAPERFYAADSEVARQKASIRTGGASLNAPASAGNTSITSSPDPYSEILGLGKRDGKVTEAMDVFSLGCVIAELWRDGAPTFTLSQLFKYREKLYDPSNALNDIPDPAIRTMVRRMIALDPDERGTLGDYLEQQVQARTFPPSFHGFLHSYLVDLQRFSPAGPGPSRQNAASSDGTAVQSLASRTQSDGDLVRQQAPADLEAKQQADVRLERLYEEWVVVMSHLDRDQGRESEGAPELVDEAEDEMTVPGDASEANHVLPVQLNIPGLSSSSLSKHHQDVREDTPALIILSPLLSNLRNALRPTSKLHALELLLHVSARSLTDEAKLDRVLPYIVALYDDANANVRAAAVRASIQLLLLVHEINPANESVCPEYCFPNLRRMATDSSVAVRIAYAACFSDLVNTAQRFLQQSQALRASGAFAADRDILDELDARSDEGGHFDVQYQDIKAFAQEQATQLLTDSSPSVKRVLLARLAPLCRLFGMATTNDVLLSHMITYLNDRDWLLRDAFFEAIADVGSVAGERSVQEYIAPLMTQAISDGQEFAMVRVVRGLTHLTRASLLATSQMYDLVSETSGLLCYPNIWLRQAAAEFLAAAVSQLDATDTWAIVYPSIRPLLKYELQTLTQSSLLEAVKAPLPRHLLQGALSWAASANKSSFWKPDSDQQSRGGLADRLGEEGLLLVADLTNPRGLKRSLVRNQEDDGHMDKLRASGLTQDDEVKLLALRDLIWKLSKHSPSERSASDASAAEHGSSAIGQRHASVQKLDGVTPQTIFFTYNTAPSGVDGDALSQAQGSVRSRTDQSFAGQMARKRITGHRVTSEGSLGSPIADLRQRINLTSTVAPHRPDSPGSRPDSLSLASPRLPSSATINSPRSASSNQTRLVSGKAAAAVGQSAANATGTMTDLAARLRGLHTSPDSPMAPSGTNTPTVRQGGQQQEDAGPLFRSTYQGSDPYIEAHLEAVFVRNFRERSAELGPKVAPGATRRRTTRNISSASVKSTSTGGSRRPDGKLIAYFDEHTSAVTALAVSSDFLFFASGSEDGTVKVWDTARLEKNVTSRSRATYSGHSAAITALIALESTHCLVSASSDGSLHVWRVDVNSGSMPKYSKPRLVSNFQLSNPGEYVTSILQSSIDSPSAKLILGTSASRIIVLDLRTMQVLQALKESPQMGPITCMCSDKKRLWVLCGTLRGMLVLWDLRFGLMIRSWAVGEPALPNSRVQITNCTLHPSKGRGRWVMVSYVQHTSALTTRQTIVETWDIDRGVLVESYDVSQSKSAATNSAAPPTGAAERMQGLQSPAAAIEHLIAVRDEQKTNHRALSAEDNTNAHNSGSTQANAFVQALLVGTEGYSSGNLGSSSAVPDGWLDAGKLAEDRNGGADADREPRGPAGYLLTGGEDCKIRFWDLGRPEKSVSIGLLGDRSDFKSVPGEGSQPARYIHQSAASLPVQRTSFARSPLLAQQQTQQAQSFMRAHKDAITSLAIIEFPFRCIVAGDRTGAIKVWE